MREKDHKAIVLPIPALDFIKNSSIMFWAEGQETGSEGFLLKLLMTKKKIKFNMIFSGLFSVEHKSNVWKIFDDNLYLLPFSIATSLVF